MQVLSLVGYDGWATCCHDATRSWNLRVSESSMCFEFSYFCVLWICIMLWNVCVFSRFGSMFTIVTSRMCNSMFYFLWIVNVNFVVLQPMSWSLQTTFIISKSWLSDHYCHLWNLHYSIISTLWVSISFLLQPMSLSLWIMVISNWSWLLFYFVYLNSIVIFLDNMGLTRKHKIDSLLAPFFKSQIEILIMHLNWWSFPHFDQCIFLKTTLLRGDLWLLVVI